MKKILITGGEMFNKGAQAMTYIVVDKLQTIYKDCEINVISDRDFSKRTDKEKANLKFNITKQNTTAATILYKTGGIFRLFKLLKIVSKKDIEKMDALYGDADMLFDISGYALGSNWGNKGSIRYLLKLILAKAYGIKTYIMPQSIGPFNYKGIEGLFIKILLKKYLCYPEKIFVREKIGYDLLVNKYGLKNVELAYDMVLTNRYINTENLFFEKPQMEVPEVLQNSVCVLPNIKNYKHGNKQEILNVYKEIVELLLVLGKCVYLARHSTEDIGPCLDIKKEFSDNEKVVLIEKEFSCFEYNELVKKFDFIIASRFHSIVHAYKNGIPAIVLGWADKYIELVKIFEQSYNVFDVRKNISVKKITDSIKKLNAECVEVSERILRTVEKLQEKDVFYHCVFQNDIKTIACLDKSLCTSCGVCAGVCPKQCIETKFINGQYIPEIKHDECTECGLCAQVCSFCNDNKSQKQHMVLKKPICYNAWMKDNAVRMEGTSGGITNGLIRSLIKKDAYSCAFCVDSFAYDKEVFSTFCNEDFSNISKSRYVPVSHKKAVEYILKNKNDKVILVATPCAVHNILNVIEKLKLNRENYLIIGLFCDKTERNSIFTYFQSLTKKTVSSLHFRNKEKNGWPGAMKFFYSDGSEEFRSASVRMKVKSYFQLEQCLYCVDKMNSFCDISVGDNYTEKHGPEKKKGENSLIIRTEMGLKAFESIEEECEKFEVSYDEILSSQKMKERKVNGVYAKLYDEKKQGKIGKSGIKKQYIKSYCKALKQLELGKQYPASAWKIAVELKKDSLRRCFIKIIRKFNL